MKRSLLSQLLISTLIIIVGAPASGDDLSRSASGAALRAVSSESGGKGKKLRVRDHRLAQQLASQGARIIATYETFSIVQVDQRTARTLRGNPAVDDVDDQRLILLNARAIDTESEERGSSTVRSAAGSGKAMHLVHFAAPPQREWYRALEANGVQIVTYIPHNTYLVYGDASAIARTRSFARNHPMVDWDGPYEAEHRIHRRITGRKNFARDPARSDLYAIQLVEDPQTNDETVTIINSKRNGLVRPIAGSLHYRNVIATLPDAALQQIAARPDVVSIQPYVIPEKNDERQNQIIAGNVTAGGEASAPGYLSWLQGLGFTQTQFDASGFVVDVTDSGVDNGTTNPNHFALFRSGTFGAGNSRVVYNRLGGFPNSNSTLAGCDGHGNINAHIIGGYSDLTGVPHLDAGGFSYGLGVAPWVRIGSTVIFDPDVYTNPDFDSIQSAAYNSGARISSNSWGSNVSGTYNSDSQEYDALVRDAQPAGSSFPAAGNQEMVILFASGNTGPNANTVGSPGTGKNVITVGASENARAFGGSDNCGTTDADADDASDMAGFSSRGPTDDSRFKPDVVAPGTHITGGVAQSTQSTTGSGSALSCFSGSGVCGGTSGSDFFPSSQSFYTASTGTSHSTPAVAGAAALLRQHFINRSMTPPSPALTKAVLMNTSRYLDGSGAGGNLPSNAQGMGEINLGDLFNGEARLFRDQLPADLFTENGQFRLITGLVADASKPVRVTLAWTDAPGSTAGNAYNNDLDLTVTVDGATYHGNVFAGSFSTTGGAADARNNVESVFLPAGTSGTLSVTVTASSINSDGLPGNGEALDQDFALVVSNFTETPSPVMNGAGSSLVTESCGPANSAIDPRELVTVAFSLQNVGSLASTNLVATLLETGGVTAAGTAQTYGVLTPQGASVARNFTFIADAACGDEIVATLELTDDGEPAGAVHFDLSTGALITGPATNVANASGIAIVDASTASPYPSVINVSGLSGHVTNVRVTLTGLSHQWPGDIDAMLVAPDGKAVMLMSDAVESRQSRVVNLTFDDAAAGMLTSWTSGTYRPSNFGSSLDTLPLPAPATYGSTLADLDGATPNGDWKLFIRDDGLEDAGALASWSLEITTAELSCCTASQTIFVVDNTSDQVAEGAGSFVATVRRAGSVAASAVRLTTSNGTASAGSDYVTRDVIVSFAQGQLEKDVSITLLDDLADEPAEDFVITLSAPSANGVIGTPASATVQILDDDNPAFAITAITPTSGSHLGGTTIELTGTGFESGAVYTVGGLPTSAVFFDSTRVTLVAPPLQPGALHHLVASNVNGDVARLNNGWLADFIDVQQSHLFHDFIESILRAGVTSGCGGGNYCPDSQVSREQMAVLLLRAKHGSAYVPPDPVLPGFNDVPAASGFKRWVEELAAQGITSGCGGGNFCPGDPVTREQMSVFLLLAKEGTSYSPPAATGVFSDVDSGSPFRRWIEELYRRGITGGCGGTTYCPSSPNTRGEMAVFLKATFGLP